MNHIETGRFGESAAAAFLQQEGYLLLERNYRCRAGEIDLIARKNGALHFIEVKTRRNQYYGRPCEAVNREKQQKIRRAAMWYLKEQEPKKTDGITEKIHFDIMEIMVHHMKDAF